MNCLARVLLAVLLFFIEFNGIEQRRRYRIELEKADLIFRVAIQRQVDRLFFRFLWQEVG